MLLGDIVYPKILIIGGHGLGDCLQAIQCADFLRKERNTQADVKLSTRDEIFQPLKHLFWNVRYTQIDPKYSNNDAILKDPNLLKEVADGYDEVYYVIPDLLFTNPLSFDFKRWKTFPHIIKTHRTLVGECNPENRIYLGLMTTTKGYLYNDIGKLAIGLAHELPEYEIYLPLTSKWDNTDIPKIEFPTKSPSNLVVTHDVPFNDNLDILKRSSYFVGTCNGPSHVAYHYGMPRLILDPQYGRMPWIARWKEDYSECIRIDTDVNSVIQIVKTNIRVPQTTLIPKNFVYVNDMANWKQELILKY